MRRNPRVVIAFGNSVGIAISTKMDPNYFVVNLVLPNEQERVIIHNNKLTFTSLLPSDLGDLTSFSEFQQSYPEYFI